MDLIGWITTAGYLGITAAVFAESGLLVGLFLPGDSLLFTSGVLAAAGVLRLDVLIACCVLAAVVGDSVGYAFGKRVGPRIFCREDSLFFNRAHLERARRFAECHGTRAIVLARFMPIVRTFVPIVAGVGRMRYAHFLTANVVGAALWGIGVPLLGYTLGATIPNIDHYLLPIIVGIVVLSVAPGVVGILRSREQRAEIAAVCARVMSRVRGSP